MGSLAGLHLVPAAIFLTNLQLTNGRERSCLRVSPPAQSVAQSQKEKEQTRSSQDEQAQFESWFAAWFTD